MFSVAAPAKINLYLHVIEKRENGFHTLDSLVAFTDLSDKVSVTASDTIEVQTIGRFSSSLNDYKENLVFRAAKSLQQYLGVPFGATIILEKNIPVASGLGGGSSDAAATIRALTSLWKIDFSVCDFLPLALRLGADVPVCLHGKAGFMTGVGEQVTLIDFLPSVQVVLLNPGVQLSTSKIFGSFSGPYSQSAHFCQSPKTLTELIDLLQDGRDNDLKKPALMLEPEIAEVLHFFYDDLNCKFANMSGSGATCFGLYSDALAANAAVKRCEIDHPGWWGVATQFIK